MGTWVAKSKINGQTISQAIWKHFQAWMLLSNILTTKCDYFCNLQWHHVFKIETLIAFNVKTSKLVKTRMHSSRMRTARSSSRAGIPPRCGHGSPQPDLSTSPLGVGLETPPKPDPSTFPRVWAWRPAMHAGIPCPPVNRFLDTRFWKYYLAPTSLRAVKTRLQWKSLLWFHYLPFTIYNVVTVNLFLMKMVAISFTLKLSIWPTFELSRFFPYYWHDS